MIRSWLSLLFCLASLPLFAVEEPKETLILSSPDQLAALSCEPSYLVGGVISPLSGAPVMRQTDLIVKGAQDVILSRVYIPPYMPCFFPKHKENQEEHDKKYLYDHLAANYKGWQFFPHLRLHWNPNLNEVRLSEPNGATFDFHVSDSGTTLASPSFAMSNASGEDLSGKYDPRNTRIFLNKQEKKILVCASDGTVRHYFFKMIFNTSYYVFFLHKEVLPNGKVLRYEYNERYQLSRVESLDPQERFVYATLHVSGSPIEGWYHFTTSSGLSAHYGYQKREWKGKFKEKIKGKKHKESFHLLSPPILTSASTPFFRNENLEYCTRILLGAYYGRDHVFTILNTGFGSPEHFRVHKFSLPVGQNDGFYPVYELIYHTPIPGEREGITHVKNSDGTATLYHFSRNLLTSSIQYFGQDGSLKKQKIFSWTEKNWLKSVEMKDGQGTLLYKKTYEFDGFGNPILETFLGDLTGGGVQEPYVIQREFSQDGRNLLLQESDEDGKTTCFSYLPNTNLVTAKLTKNKEKIFFREFSKYDDCHNLIQTISYGGGR